MERSSLIMFLREIESNLKLKSHKYYLFGSACRTATCADVDLLIVYDLSTVSMREILSLRRVLKDRFWRTFRQRLDVCLLSAVEDRNNCFRNEEGAIRVA
jgi:predicted nucleotidyltransferase